MTWGAKRVFCWSDLLLTLVWGQPCLQLGMVIQPCAQQPLSKGEASCCQQDPSRATLAAPARGRLIWGLWLRPGPLGCTATFCLLPGPAGTGAVAISPFLHWAGGRQQSCVMHGDTILANPAVGCDVFGFFSWPDCPPAGKPHKGYAEMWVLVHLVGAILLNETPWNMPGSPWGC